MAAYDSLMVFTGNANPELAQRVVKHLDISLGEASVSKFSDGEIAIELMENVRGRDVFILQPTCAPTNDNLMEILTMADALKRASAGRITAAIPYFGYARQDRRPRSVRVPISAKLVAKKEKRHVRTQTNRQINKLLPCQPTLPPLIQHG